MSSKIKVDTIENVAGSGNVSLGSGHNLVVPGNLTVDTTTLKVDSSNNRVGIGTASPEETLEVVHATAPAIQLNRTNDGGFKSILRQQGNDFEIRGSSGSTKIYTGNADGDSSTARLLINASGHVTMPSQPSWFQYVIGGGTFSSGWKNVPLNPNASTDFPYHIAGGVTTANANHEVTVPVAGHYQINGAVTLDSGSVNTDGTLTLSKNNSTMSGGQSSGVYNGALGGTTISYVVELAANDTIGLDYYFSGSATYRNTAYAGYFSGYLLG